MTALDLLGTLHARGATISLSGDRIHVNAPKGTLTPDLLDSLAANKSQLIRLLNSQVEFISCPGDNCEEVITLVSGQGHCHRHNMAITITDNLCA
jgi:hypothetical protein